MTRQLFKICYPLVLILFILLTSCKQKHQEYDGYIDADLIYLSSNYPGRLTQLLVHRGQNVHQDQLLFRLEQSPELDTMHVSILNYDSLLAQKEQIVHQLHYAQSNRHRMEKMHQQHAASQNDVDLAIRDEQVLNDQLMGINAQIKSSKVDIANKRWQISRKEAFASTAGIVYDTYYTEHEYLQAGQPIVSLITPKNIKVVFFVPESALSSLKLNTPLRFSTDACPSFATGHIRYIASIAQYTPPIIYSREERQKLVFRVEASVDEPNLEKIHLGQPISLEVLS